MNNKELSALLVKAMDRADKFYCPPPGKSRYCPTTLVEQINMILDFLKIEDDRSESTNVIQLSQPHWFGDSQIFYKEDIEDALKSAGVKFKVREL